MFFKITVEILALKAERIWDLKSSTFIYAKSILGGVGVWPHAAVGLGVKPSTKRSGVLIFPEIFCHCCVQKHTMLSSGILRLFFVPLG